MADHPPLGHVWVHESGRGRKYKWWRCSICGTRRSTSHAVATHRGVWWDLCLRRGEALWERTQAAEMEVERLVDVIEQYVHGGQARTPESVFIGVLEHHGRPRPDRPLPLASALAEREAALAALRLLQAERDGDVWYWMGDGSDEPESLSAECAVLMSSDQLRAMASALAEVDRLRGERDEALARWERFCDEAPASPDVRSYRDLLDPQSEEE